MSSLALSLYLTLEQCYGLLAFDDVMNYRFLIESIDSDQSNRRTVDPDDCRLPTADSVGSEQSTPSNPQIVCHMLRNEVVIATFGRLLPRGKQ